MANVWVCMVCVTSTCPNLERQLLHHGAQHIRNCQPVHPLPKLLAVVLQSMQLWRALRLLRPADAVQRTHRHCHGIDECRAKKVFDTPAAAAARRAAIAAAAIAILRHRLKRHLRWRKLKVLRSCIFHDRHDRPYHLHLNKTHTMGSAVYRRGLCLLQYSRRKVL